MTDDVYIPRQVADYAEWAEKTYGIKPTATRVSSGVWRILIDTGRVQASAEFTSRKAGRTVTYTYTNPILVIDGQRRELLRNSELLTACLKDPDSIEIPPLWVVGGQHRSGHENASDLAAAARNSLLGGSEKRPFETWEHRAPDLTEPTEDVPAEVQKAAERIATSCAHFEDEGVETNPPAVGILDGRWAVILTTTRMQVVLCWGNGAERRGRKSGLLWLHVYRDGEDMGRFTESVDAMMEALLGDGGQHAAMPWTTGAQQTAKRTNSVEVRRASVYRV
jgi:hypothetical protein